MNIVSSAVTAESSLPLFKCTEITGTESDSACKDWTNGEHNWTIGYCNSCASCYSNGERFVVHFDMCTHVNKMSKQSQHCVDCCLKGEC